MAKKNKNNDHFISRKTDSEEHLHQFQTTVYRNISSVHRLFVKYL